MKKKELLFIIVIYFLVLAQVSFFPRFGIFSNPWIQNINLVLLLIAIVSLFEKQKNNTGIMGAVFGGLFLDLYSERFFGFWILALLSLAVLIKFIVKRYVRLPSLW